MPSRNDQLFKRRKAQRKADLERRNGFKSEIKRALIVCEGEKTEPIYFKDLIGVLGLTSAEVEVCGDSGAAPESVVKLGIRKLKDDSDFDLVFFVFDKDSHASYDVALRRVSDLKRKRDNVRKEILAITSVPCFELWFLLHFKAVGRPYVASQSKSACGNLISDLKRQPGFSNYHKSRRNIFAMLRDRLSQAKANAKRALERSEAEGETMHHGNPTTHVHLLVESLEKVAAEAKE